MATLHRPLHPTFGVPIMLGHGTPPTPTNWTIYSPNSWQMLPWIWMVNVLRRLRAMNDASRTHAFRHMLDFDILVRLRHTPTWHLGRHYGKTLH